MTRLRAMYVSGDNSMLNVLLSANDFGDFLYRDQLLSSVTDHDNAIMEQLKSDISAVEELENQANAEKRKSALTQRPRSTPKDRSWRPHEGSSIPLVSDLEGQNQALKISLPNIRPPSTNSRRKFRPRPQRQPQPQTTIKITTATAEAIPREASFPSPIKRMGVALPRIFTTSRPMSAPVGGRTHNGLDIAGSNIYGQPIVAARVGIGYRRRLEQRRIRQLCHDKPRRRLYHNLRTYVKRRVPHRQSVSAGQVIGYVGNTGRSNRAAPFILRFALTAASRTPLIS